MESAKGIFDEFVSVLGESGFVYLNLLLYLEHGAARPRVPTFQPFIQIVTCGLYQLPYEILLDAVMKTEGMVVTVSQPVTNEIEQKNATLTFAHVNHTIAASGPAIDSTDYVPNTQLPVKYAAQSFTGGSQAFADFVLSKLELQPEDSIRHDLGVDQIWRIFQAAFTPADSMMSYEPILRTFYQQLFAALIDDGINWVEIRASASSGILVHQGDEDADPNLDVYWQVMVEELDKFKQSDKGKNFWGARVIWSDIRSEDRASLTSSKWASPLYPERWADMTRHEGCSREKGQVP